MAIRQAKRKDLKQIASVHSECFPDSFSTQWGEKLLIKYYLDYIKANPDLFLVATERGKIVGFCMGYLMENPPSMKEYLKHNLWDISKRCLWLLVTGNKQLYWKIGETFKKKEGYHIVDISIHSRAKRDMGVLLSICVLPKYRSTGLAGELLEQYVSIIGKKGRSVCLLSVDPDNERAVHFYENHGFTLYRISSKSVTYARRLE